MHILASFEFFDAGQTSWYLGFAGMNAIVLSSKCLLERVTPKGVLPPALCHASATREGP